MPYGYGGSGGAGEGFTVGDIKWAAVDAVPAGWLACDGAAVSRTTYAALFAAIGTTFGAGNGTTTFNPPNLKDRVAVGKSTTRALACSGGEETHALTEAEGPSHSHGLTGMPGAVVTDVSGCTCSVNVSGGSCVLLSSINCSMCSELPTAADACGSGTAHNNMQPYLVLRALIKAA